MSILLLDRSRWTLSSEQSAAAKEINPLDEERIHFHVGQRELATRTAR